MTLKREKLYFLLLLLCNGMMAQSLSDGLVAWYCLDGDAQDNSDSSNHGTLNGGTLASDRFGNSGSALYFDGKQDNITVAAPLEGSSYSFSFWVEMETMTTGVAFWFGNTITSNRVSGSVNYSHNGTNSAFWDVGAVSPPCRTEKVGKVFPTTWEHYVMTHDSATATSTLYVDGQVLKTNTCTNIRDLKGVPLYIASAAGTLYFKGTMDDFRIYNRALTAQEVQLLYNHQGGCDSNQTGSIIVYPNPSTQTAKIKGNTETYELYNMTGQSVLKGTGEDMDMSGLPEGVYLLRINKLGSTLLFKRP